MKLGYQTNTWGGVVGHPGGVTSVKDAYYVANGSTEQALKDIAQAGYKGFELFDGNFMQYENNQKEFENLLKLYNLDFIGVYTGANFIYKDIQEDEFHKIDKVAKMASSFGAEHLVVGGGAIRSSGIKESDYSELARSLERVSEIAETYGLTPSYHPHLGSLIEKPDQLERIMELNSSIYLCPDTAHIEAGGGDPVAVIKKYASRIKYVHFKDYGSGAFLPLGKGSQNFREMVTVLQDMKYDGWLTVELDSYEDPLQGALISKKFLQESLNLT
jgi:inosose dehydratase